MSRIGKLKIPVPQGVTVDMNGQDIKVKGKLGELSMTVHPRITVERDDEGLHVKRGSDIKQDKALHGLTRALLANMITGVSEGFTKVLETKGVGYRADMKTNLLVLNLGYSNPIEYPVPEDLKIEVDKQNNITITGIDKCRVGQIAADIRGFRPPDHYKGKGIRYRGEKVRIKEGKSGGKK